MQMRIGFYISTAAARAWRYLNIGHGVTNRARDGQFPKRIAFGGNLARDAVRTEPV